MTFWTCSFSSSAFPKKRQSAVRLGLIETPQAVWFYVPFKIIFLFCDGVVSMELADPFTWQLWLYKPSILFYCLCSFYFILHSHCLGVSDFSSIAGTVRWPSGTVVQCASQVFSSYSFCSLSLYDVDHQKCPGVRRMKRSNVTLRSAAASRI